MSTSGTTLQQTIFGNQFLEDIAVSQEIQTLPLEIIFDDLPVGVAIVPVREHALRYSNKQLKTLLGSSKEFETFREIADCVAPAIDLAAHVIRAIDSDEISTSKPFLHDTRWLTITVNPAASNTDYCLITVEDCTPQKVQEAAKNEFFSLLSHELRTPLIAVSGCAKLIRDFYQGNYPDKLLDDMTDEIIRTGDHLLSMVNDFLNMDRLESGRFSYKIEECKPYAIANELLRDLSPIAKERNLALKLWPERPLAATMMSDGQRIKQILTNLCGNSLKFTEKGEVGISLEETRDEVIFRVYDTGQGIAPEDRAMVFDKYRQAKNPFLVDPNRSSGLGLYISKLMAEGMGGSLTIEWSELGKGSTFALRMPYTAKVKPS